MAMAEQQEPLLCDSPSSPPKGKDHVALPWLLASVLWIAFAGWIAVLVIFPTLSLRNAEHSGWGSSSFGLTGLVLLLFGFPPFLLAGLATAYLQTRPKPTAFKRKKKPANISLWTCPVLVDGPLGVVSAAEVVGIIAFVAYLAWAMANFIIQDTSLIKRFMEMPFIRMRFMLWQLWTYVVGLRLGFLGLICMAFLFLPVARGSPLLRLVDIPFEHAVRYHVWLGHLTMSFFTLHGLCYVVVWVTQGRLWEELLAWQSIGVANLPGVISLLAGIALWMTSFGCVRQGSFELFFYTHQLYVVFVVFMAFHIGHISFCICLAGIFLYMLDRFLRFCQSRRAVQVLASRVLPCGTIELLLSKPQDLKYNSLSFVFLCVPNVSWLQWHPFSVSSSPYDAQDNMALLIKPLGSWTRELQEIVSGTRGTGCPLLGVEGPYGHESDYYLDYEVLVLVAGGIGVSPFIAILRDILHRYNMNHANLPREVTLIWAVKSAKELNTINLVQPEIVSTYPSRLKLTVHAYVTRETKPDVEDAGDAVPSIPEHIFTLAKKSSPQRPISTLVGTYSNLWVAAYLVVAVCGFFLVEGILQKFLLGALKFPGEQGSGSSTSLPTSWTVRATILLLSMASGTVLFGGLVILCWNRVESFGKSAPVENGELHKSWDGSVSLHSLVGPWNTVYGQRPDLKELFNGLAKRWSEMSVGVLVCGPATLQTSVAAECRAHNTKLGGKAPVFHYHSVSFDL